MDAEYFRHLMRRERHIITDIFFKEFDEKFGEGYVPVLVRKFNSLALYGVQCDRNGYPSRSSIDFPKLFIPSAISSSVSALERVEPITAVRETLYLKQPLRATQIYNEYSYGCSDYIVTLWEGEISDGTSDIKELSVSELMRLARNVAERQAPERIETAQKNKPIR